MAEPWKSFWCGETLRFRWGGEQSVYYEKQILKSSIFVTFEYIDLIIVNTFRSPLRPSSFLFSNPSKSHINHPPQL